MVETFHLLLKCDLNFQCFNPLRKLLETYSIVEIHVEEAERITEVGEPFIYS